MVLVDPSDDLGLSPGQIFSKYQKHRRLLLDDILASIARLPSSKRSLRTYKLNSAGPGEADVHIQMLTALVLQLIQCVVVLPNYLAKAAARPSGADQDQGDEQEEKEIEVRAGSLWGRAARQGRLTAPWRRALWCSWRVIGLFGLVCCLVCCVGVLR